MNKYDVGGAVGKGQWGVVYRGKRKSDRMEVAVKRVRPADEVEGVNFQVLREIKMLRGVDHEHVVKLLDVVPEVDGLCMIFELMATDLEKVLYESSRSISSAVAKGYSEMLLGAVSFLASHFVFHRDIKPANLLISHGGVLKLADFGYARYLADENCLMSDQCCTLWYRPPELLFGANEYGLGIDAWSSGCVIAEISLKKPIFQGESDIDQLAKIFRVAGVPTEDDWNGVTTLRKFLKFSPPATSVTLRTYLQIHNRLESELVDLLVGLLSVDPKHRDDAAAALDRPYFSNPPRPVLRPI